MSADKLSEQQQSNFVLIFISGVCACVVFGIYFHWPYCLSKCIYCDFGTTILPVDINQQHYAENCKKQLEYFKEKIKQTEPITSIYFGGGTPSLLEPNIITELVDCVKSTFNVSTNCEITLEANPTSFEVNKFEKFYQAGVNRLSLGVQSMDDIELQFLGRRHTVAQAVAAINEIKHIFPRWTFDLIYGLPKQTLTKWLDELARALELGSQHLSLYTLIVDENTLLGQMVARGIVIPKTDDELADFYDATNEFINQNSDLKHYEVSNYAVSGQESRHNLAYWNSDDYIGIGAGAHGRLRYTDGQRYELQSIFNPKQWNDNIANGGNGLEVERALIEYEQAEEILIMGLRTKFGIDLEDIHRRFGFDLRKYLDTSKLAEFAEHKLVIYDNKRLKLTYHGLKVLDGIVRKININ